MLWSAVLHENGWRVQVEDVAGLPGGAAPSVLLGCFCPRLDEGALNQTDGMASSLLPSAAVWVSLVKHCLCRGRAVSRSRRPLPTGPSSGLAPSWQMELEELGWARQSGAWAGFPDLFSHPPADDDLGRAGSWMGLSLPGLVPHCLTAPSDGQ